MFEKNRLFFAPFTKEGNDNNNNKDTKNVRKMQE